MINEKRLLAYAAVAVPSVIALLGIWQNSDQFARGEYAEKEVTQTFIGPIDPLNDLVGIASRNSDISLIIGDKTYSNLSIQQLVLKNEGKVPILPGDFIEALRIHANEGWQIIAIRNSELTGQVNLTWSELPTKEFEAAPFLLNPGETIWQILYLTRPDDSVKPRDEPGPPINLTARIINLPKFSTKETDDWKLAPPPIVSLSLGAAVFVIFVAAVTLVWYVWALLRIGLRRFPRWKLISSLVAYSALSYATAEVLAFYLFPTLSSRMLGFDIKYQWHNWLILLTQIATAGYLVYRMKGTEGPQPERS